jgi:hypothetical protein
MRRRWGWMREHIAGGRVPGGPASTGRRGGPGRWPSAGTVMTPWMVRTLMASAGPLTSGPSCFGHGVPSSPLPWPFPGLFGPGKG